MKSLVSQFFIQSRVFLALYVSILTVLIMYTRIITGSPVPSKDSGVFLYIGEAILRGGVPYVNVWDNKPPLIYFIDAFGLLLGHNTIWGVTTLDAVSIFVSLALATFLIKTAFSSRIALIGVSNMAALLLFLIPSNMTEGFALCFTMLALYSFYLAEIGKKPLWLYSIIGLCSSLLFLLKPTFIGVPLSIMIVMLMQHRHTLRLLMQKLLVFFAGVLAPLLLVGIYLLTHHAFFAFIDQVIVFNHEYMQSGTFGFFDSAISGLTYTASLSLLAFVGYLIVCIRWKYLRKDPKRSLLVCIALIDLPLELYFSGLPARAYSQYFVPWLPSLLILSSFLIASIFDRIHTIAKETAHSFREIITLVDILSIILLSMLFYPLLLFSRTYEHYQLANSAYVQVVDFITTHTTSHDYVLFWGYGTHLNYASHRQSPTRYSYQASLYTKGYQSPLLIETLSTDLKKHPPRYIIDTSSTDATIPPLDPTLRKTFTPLTGTGYLPQMKQVFTWITNNYTYVGAIGRQHWQVYRLSHSTL